MWLSNFTRVWTTPAISSLTPSLPALIVTAVSYYLVQTFNIYMVSQLNGRNNESHWVYIFVCGLYTQYFNNFFLINNLKLNNIILFLDTIRKQYCCTINVSTKCPLLQFRNSGGLAWKCFIFMWTTKTRVFPASSRSTFQALK